MSFGLHAGEQATKGKRVIGSIWGVLGRWTDPKHFLEIYEKQIMPLIYYALPVACPMDKKHWLLLEKCQRFAALLAVNDYSATYVELLGRLHLKLIARLCVE
ncbi:MAG: hypothetical protein GY696_00150 [Gammaproteobacteria bacterium]|nr:hypothetical protein [Gammaproteobacteria bacterium]